MREREREKLYSEGCVRIPLKNVKIWRQQLHGVLVFKLISRVLMPIATRLIKFQLACQFLAFVSTIFSEPLKKMG